MRSIRALRGEAITIDDDDYEALNKHRWRIGTGGYAIASFYPFGGKRTVIYLHRVVIHAPADAMVDHINGDTLDCRRANLRLVTSEQNTMNKATEYHGIRRTPSGKYQVRIAGHYVGLFNTIEKANSARDEAEVKYFGEYRRNRHG